MSILSHLRSASGNLFPRSERRDVEEELHSHIAHRADDLERNGIPRAEAERRARIEFGGYEKYRQQSHEQAGGQLLESLAQDLRYAVRSLTKSPGFTITAVITLALAIGANAVVFSMLNSLILRPLSLPDADRLVMVEHGADRSPLQSYPDYVDLRDRNHSFSGLAAYEMYPAGLDTGGKASPIWLYLVSGNYFDVLGVRPYLGRFFHPSDEHGPDSVPYIVLGYAFWQSHFHGDPKIIGQQVQVNKHPYTVLGVAAQQFRGTELYFQPDLWFPMLNAKTLDAGVDLTQRSDRSRWLIGRLKPGVTEAQAASDLASIASVLAKSYPKEDEAITFPLGRPGLAGDMLGGPVKAFMTGLMLLSGLILLAACANLGSLFAARSAERSKEIALRLAFGSSRSRILRQLITEAVLISLMGGAAGLAIAVVLLRSLSTWQPTSNFPINIPVYADLRVYLMALLLALLSGLLFGAVPMGQVLRSDPYHVVKSGGVGAAGRKLTLRDLLLVVQVMVCAMLVTASLVAMRGLERSLHSDFGFVPQNVMLESTDLDMAGYTADQVPIMQRKMIDAMSTIPGVNQAAMIDWPPLSMGWSTTTVFEDRATDLSSAHATAEPMSYIVSPGYFAAAGTTLLEGRDLSWHDDKNSPRVAVVNREFVRKVLGRTSNAVGSFFKRADGSRIQIVGIVEDGRYRTLTEDPQPAMFRPALQSPTSAIWLVVRSQRDPRQLAAAMDSTLRNLDPGMPFSLRTWTEQLDSALLAPRIATVALGVLGGLGALLAVAGIFGMASYSVTRRLREFGIRIALGAQHKEVLTAALGKALRLLAVGSIAGLVLGILGSKVLASIVYQATPRDPVVLLGALIAMLLVGAVATWIPAWRAMRADPLVLLRED